MNTVQGDYKQLIENGIPPGRGGGETEAWCGQGGACLQERDFAVLTLSDQLILWETGAQADAEQAPS